MKEYKNMFCGVNCYTTSCEIIKASLTKKKRMKKCKKILKLIGKQIIDETLILPSWYFDMKTNQRMIMENIIQISNIPTRSDLMKTGNLNDLFFVDKLFELALKTNKLPLSLMPWNGVEKYDQITSHLLEILSLPKYETSIVIFPSEYRISFQAYDMEFNLYWYEETLMWVQGIKPYTYHGSYKLVI